MLDLLILNGTCPDFEAGEMKKLHIGIEKGRIAEVIPADGGAMLPEAAEIIDASGKIVSPGFIDIHMHEDNFAGEGRQFVIGDMMLNMGVTTAVGGNCGVQYQPMAEFKEVIEELGGSPVNYVMLAGYNTYRRELGLGRYDHASREQMEILRGIIRRELEEGAWGMSFGIEYDPGITYEEMTYACSASEDPNHFVSAHYRDECKSDVSPVEEMIRLAEEIPQKFQISHLSSCAATGKMKEALECINAAIEKNPKLNFDTYPYNAFSTHIGSTVFEDGCLEEWHRDYSDILLTDEPYKNVRCTKEIFEDARANHPDILAVAFVMNEEEIAAAIANSYGMVASDAIINHGGGHPRAAGTFPRVLAKYVREEKLIPMVDALRKITLEPAVRMGLDRKGRLEAGCDADITIFDPDAIEEKADWSHLEAPEGIEYVLIGGEKAIARGQRVNPRLGRVLDYGER